MKVSKKNMIILVIVAVLAVYCVFMVFMLTRPKNTTEPETVADTENNVYLDDNYIDTEIIQETEVPDFQQLVDMNNDYQSVVNEWSELLESEPTVIDTTEEENDAVYVYGFYGTDAIFTVIVDSESNVTVSDVKNNYNSKYPIIMFQNGIPKNAEEIYQKLKENAFTGVYTTDYVEGGDIISFYNLSDGAYYQVNLVEVD